MSNASIAKKPLKSTQRGKSRHSIPKTLFAFANAKVIGLYRCRCGCVHYGISEPDALAYVAKMNKYLSSLDDLEVRDIFGGRTVSIDPFKRCFFCSATGNEMVRVSNDEKNFSISHQPVIVQAVQAQSVETPVGGGS